VLSDLLSKHDHVAILLGDGDFNDASHRALGDAINEVKSSSPTAQELVYFALDLYEGGDDATLCQQLAATQPWTWAITSAPP
jgi:hypothetical protein